MKTSTPMPTLSALRFALTLRSSNRKTGPIPVSVSGQQSCPDSCPFRGNGCYAQSGPLAIHWAAVTAGRRGMPWRQFLTAVAAIPAGSLWRHNAAGDLWRPSTAAGRRALGALTEANRGRRGFTYSHHKLTASVVQAFRAATANGFTVNASCESEKAADAAIAYGLRAVFVVPSTDSRTVWKTEGGNRAVVCPAQRFKDMTCERCQLCHSRPSHIAVVFRAHGTHRRRIDEMLIGAGDE